MDVENLCQLTKIMHYCLYMYMNVIVKQYKSNVINYVCGLGGFSSYQYK